MNKYILKVNELMDEWTNNEWMNELMIESMNYWIIESMNYWIIEYYDFIWILNPI